LVKGLALASPSEQSERFEPVVRLFKSYAFACILIIAFCTRNQRRTKAEYSEFFKIALSVIRALHDKLLICACRLFQLGNPFKARIEFVQWKRLAVEQENIKKHISERC